MIEKKLTDNQLLFLQYLSQGLNPNQILNIFKKSLKKTISADRIVKSLEKRNYIEIKHISHKLRTYLLTAKCYSVLQQYPRAVLESVYNNDRKINRVRIHKLEIKVSIQPVFLKSWEKRRNQLLQLPDYRIINLNNNTQGVMKIGTIKIRTTTRSVLFYPNDIYAQDYEQACVILNDLVFKTLEKLNQKLKFPIYKEIWQNVDISKQEIAFMNDPLAQKYIDSGIRAIIKVNDERRLVIDFSKKVPEFEAVHSKFAPEDAQKWEEFSKNLITDQFKPMELTNRVNIIEHYQNLTIQNQAEFSNNLKKHLNVLEEMSITMKAIRDSLKK